MRALAALTDLECSGHGGKGQLSDFSPLQGMQLLRLSCHYNKASDLSPLQGMPLGYLNCDSLPVSDLRPLQALPLSNLICRGTQVSDLSPLENCRTLGRLDLRVTKVTPAQVAALQKVLPNCKIDWDDPAKAPTKKLAYLDPTFQRWVADTQKLPAEKQIEAVSKKLMELNPGFDGKEKHSIQNGVVTLLDFRTDHVTDISPVRALAGLQALYCTGREGNGKLADLSPLAGMKLETLMCGGNSVSDLSPLTGCRCRSFFVATHKCPTYRHSKECP